MSATLGNLAPTALISGDASGVSPSISADGRLALDGSDVRVTIGPPTSDKDDDDWNRNLAETLPPEMLASCAMKLIQDIDADNQSRQGWLDNRTQALALLGLELQQPRGDVGASTAPLEGMSTVVAPLLLAEVLKAQASARGELLPASGPVKVVVEGDASAGRDELADALELDMNTYLTEVCSEYYPDTDRMLFYTVLGGAGFKKVYHCPIRQRPVSESVDAADLIVNAGATDLENARRITHVVRMRDSDARRMMIAGAWRQIELGQPFYEPDAVREKKADIEGVLAQSQQYGDQDRTIYEVLCEWDFGEGPDGLAIPYRITVDKDSRQVLEIRRNWREDDSLYRSRQVYVRYPYIDAIGIYGIGLLHLLGNTTRAITAAWREMLDAGMYANFPGFLYSEAVARQDSNEFRVPPGGGMKVQTGGRPLAEVVMPLPYKPIQVTLLEFLKLIQDDARLLAGAAEIPVGEGKSNLPVGTILATLEQATRVMSAVHKRMHAAQAQEFRLLKERLREDPEAFWAHGRRRMYAWDKETFLKALDEYELSPVADPNEPTRAHRLLKAQAIKTLQSMNPALYDGEKVDTHLLRLLGVSAPAEFFNHAPAAQPNPAIEMVKAKMQEAQASIAQKAKDAQLRLVETGMKAHQDALDRASKERIEQMRLAIEAKKIGADLAAEATKGMAADERPQAAI